MPISVITFIAPINEFSVHRLFDSAHASIRNGCDEIHLHIASHGGNVNCSFVAYNYLRTLDVPLTTFNLSHIESSANIIYLAGEKRGAAPHASFMFHASRCGIESNPDTILLRQTIEMIDFDNKRMADVFEERTNKGVDIRSHLIGESKRLSVDDAMRYGIVTADCAELPGIPRDAKLHWILP